MATYLELLEKDYARQIDFNNVKKYHEQGYKGKGVAILNAEGVGNHRNMTSKVIKCYAPEATLLESNISAHIKGDKVLYARITIYDETLDLEKAIDKYKIKIINRSFAGSSPKPLLTYFRDIQKRKGVIFFCAAGNNGYEGITGMWAKDDTAIAVGALRILDNCKLELYRYSSRGDELDFVSFLAKGEGTSAASPALAAQTALLINKYGDFGQRECVEILKSISIRLGPKTEYGWGLPILPLEDELKIIVGGTEMIFTDIEQDRWSKPAIDRCVAEGLLVGFEDGTFRPTEHVTREQFAQILTRILDKIEGR